jgi:hypothetical protein
MRADWYRCDARAYVAIEAALVHSEVARRVPQAQKSGEHSVDPGDLLVSRLNMRFLGSCRARCQQAAWRSRSLERGRCVFGRREIRFRIAHVQSKKAALHCRNASGDGGASDMRANLSWRWVVASAGIPGQWRCNSRSDVANSVMKAEAHFRLYARGLGDTKVAGTWRSPS